MLEKQFYTQTTIPVFSFFISFVIYVSSSNLTENVENFSSTSSNQLWHNDSNLDYNDESFKPKIYIATTTIRPKKYPITKNMSANIDSNNTDFFNFNEENELFKKYMKKLTKSKEEFRRMEKRTKRQWRSKEWHMERKYRLTSRRFGRACRLYTETSCKKYAYYLLHGYPNNNEEINYGLQNMDRAKRSLERILEKKIRHSGLMIDFEIPFLAASPDGAVGRNGIVEIKCPILAQNMTPYEAIFYRRIKYVIIKQGKLHLRRSSNYYYQVQGQLHISSKLYCYFAVWTPKGMLVEKIVRNDTFWNRKMRSQLEWFYLKFFLPELIRSDQIK